VIVENRTRWSGEDLSSLLHTAFNHHRNGPTVTTWFNAKTVVAFFTYAARKDSKTWGTVKPNHSGNYVEIKLIRPERVEVGVVDRLASVLHGMPPPFVLKTAYLLDRAVKGAWTEANERTRVDRPEWFTDDMRVGVLKKAPPNAPAFYAAKAHAQQKALDHEHRCWIKVRASRQAAIDKLKERALAP